MAHVFRFSILQAVPDLKRGEKVNIGIVVFRDSDVDLRFSDLAKLRLLTGHNWDQYTQDAALRISSCFDAKLMPNEIIESIGLIERTILLSSLSQFVISDASQYETRVIEILETLVERPKQRRRDQSIRINTEIAREFRKAKVLAKPDESVDTHKVVRDFYVSQDEGLKADFVLKNGVYHVTATLDLRRPNVNLGHAALKAVVLDKAKLVDRHANKIGVYALIGDPGQYRPHVELLKDYSDKTYNWSNPFDREAYTREIYHALYSGNS